MDTPQATRTPQQITLLVVDDVEDLREAIAFEFRNKGYRVLTAGSATEAYETLNTQKIDLVLTDVRMPGGDGVELLDRIKAAAQGSPPPPAVILISGDSALTQEEAHKRGAAAMFGKPFDRQELVGAVRRITSKLPPLVCEQDPAADQYTGVQPTR